MNIYVGNLSPETTEHDLRQAFEAFGQVMSDEGQTATSELNGKNLKGHTINVEEGRMKTGHHIDRNIQDGFGGDRGDRDRRDGFDRGGRGGRRY
jgi:RNA recognition motif-containing protein